MNDEHQPDPVIVETVTHVRDRFGVTGLRELIELARRELAEAQAALEELSNDEP